MAIAFVAQAKANGNGTYSTSAIDTTGATLLVVCYSDDGDPVPTLSDSKGNTWIEARRYGPFGPAINIRYAWNPTVGTGHTITLTGAGQAGSAQFWAFSGVDASADPLDQSNNDHAFGSTTVSPGSVTPTSDGQLIIAADNFDAMASVPTVNGGFSSPSYGDVGSGGTYMGSASTYLIQTTAAAANPTFTTPGSNNQYAAIATFEAGAAAPPATIEAQAFVLRPPGRIAPTGIRSPWFGTGITSADVTGTAAASLGGLTATATGTREVTGSAVIAFGSLTATASGVRDTFGTAAAALGSLGATAVGTRDTAGTAVATLGGLTATATGQRAVDGSAAAAFGALTATASGQGTVLGVAVASFGGLSASATDGLSGVIGSGVASLGALTATATGQVERIASATSSFGGLTAIGAGQRDVAGQAAAALGALAATATALRIVQGVAAANLGGLAATALSTGLAPSITGLRTTDSADRIRSTDTIAPARTTSRPIGERTTS